MPVPDLLRQDMDEADAVVDGALVDRVGRQEAVDVVGAQVGDHLGRRHGADLDVRVGIDAVLGHVVAQQVVVHRVVEGHRELEALPGLGIALVLVLDGERDGLAVDVLDRRHGVGDRIGADAHRDRERHRREHVGGVVFLVERLVADHGPAGGLHHLHVEAVLGVEAHRVRHDDGRGAGDRDEPDLEVLLLGRRPARTPRSLSPSGKNCEIAASAVEAPTARRNVRRRASSGNSARTTADSTTRDRRASEDARIAASCSASLAWAPQLQPPLRNARLAFKGLSKLMARHPFNRIAATGAEHSCGSRHQRIG